MSFWSKVQDDNNNHDDEKIAVNSYLIVTIY